MSNFDKDPTYRSRELQRIFMDSNPHRYPEGKSKLPLAQNTETYLAWFLNRIKHLSESGLPIPDSWFNEDADLFARLKFFIDANAKFDGWYDPIQLTITLKRDLDVPLNVTNQSPGYTLIHELWHFMGGIQWSITDGILQIERTTGFSDGTFTAAQQMLLEATAEALTRWTISDTTPDFKTMSTEDFFVGPSDVPITVYIQHQKAVGRVLKDMPLDVLLRGHFADSTTVNGQSQYNQDYSAFCEALDKTVEGGWQTIEKIAKLLDPPSIPLPNFVKNNPFLAEVSRKISEYRMSRVADRALDRN